MQWRMKTMPDDAVEDISGMSEEEAVNKARKILEDAGMNREVMEHALGWDEFVFGLYTDTGGEYLEGFKKKDFDDSFIADCFVMLITTD